MRTKTLVSLILPLSLLSGLLTAAPLGTAFTCQGKLTDGMNAANGLYDLRFAIYDAAGGSGLVAGPLTNAGVLSITGNADNGFQNRVGGLPPASNS